MFVFCTHIHAICLSLMYCISIVHGTFVVCDAHTFLVWHRLGAYKFSEDRDEELCRQEVVILSPMSDPRTQVPRGVIYIYIYVILYFRWISHKQFLNLFKYIQVENQMVFKHINHIQSLIFATGYGSIFSVQELLSPVDQGPPVLHLIGVLTGVRMLGLEWVFPICMGQGCGKECHRESCYFQKIPGILEWNFGREQHRFRHGFSKIRMYSKLLMN